MVEEGWRGAVAVDDPGVNLVGDQPQTTAKKAKSAAIFAGEITQPVGKDRGSHRGCASDLAASDAL
jgi:hypothetical protein